MLQLCTEDGATLWHANQADNIDDDQLRELAYHWNEVKQAKLSKITSLDAAHLAALLLHEAPARRPTTWDQVLQHPFLAVESGAVSRKRIVMSCPEMGTLDQDGGVARVAAGHTAAAVYGQHVMTKVVQLQKIGFVKLGFDRAGTSTARKKDARLFKRAGALREAGRHEESVSLLKSTDWWYGYQTSVKQTVKLESQGFPGELEIICIKGGFVTQLEAAEMENIMAEATADCLKSEIAVKYRITEVSFYDFLSGYEPVLGSDGPPGATTHRQAQRPKAQIVPDQCDDSVATDSVMAVDPHGAYESDLRRQLAEAAAQLAATAAAKDEELAAAVAAKDEELAAKDEELAAAVAAAVAAAAAAKDEELEELRSQLERLEGVPPQRVTRDPE